MDECNPSDPPIDYCPVCALTCKGADAKKKLEKLTKKMMKCCGEKSCDPVEVDMVV